MRRGLFLFVGIGLIVFLSVTQLVYAVDPAEVNPYRPQDLFQAVADLKIAAEGRSPSAGTRFAMLSSGMTPLWTTVQTGAARASAEVDVPITFIAPSTAGQVSQQLAMLEAFVKYKYNVIAFSARNRDAAKDVVQKAVNDSIPVLCSDSDATGSARSIYIGMSDYDAGRAAGEAALRVVGKGKIVGLAGDGTAQNTRDRIAGVKDVLEGTELNLVEVLLDDIKPDVASNNAWTAMQRYPDLAAIITFYSYEGPMAGQAVSSAGKSGEVKIVAFGAEPETQQLMEQGVVQAIIGERTYFYGYLSAYVMYAMSVLGEEETLRVLEPYLSDWPARPSGDVMPDSEGRIHLDTGFDVVGSDSLDSYQAYLERIDVTSQ